MLLSIGVYEQINCVVVASASDVMSWNELYWKSRNDTDLRSLPGAGSTGSRRNAEITGYQHLFSRGQEEQPTTGVDGLHLDTDRV